MTPKERLVLRIWELCSSKWEYFRILNLGKLLEMKRGLKAAFNSINQRAEPTSCPKKLHSMRIFGRSCPLHLRMKTLSHLRLW